MLLHLRCLPKRDDLGVSRRISIDLAPVHTPTKDRACRIEHEGTYRNIVRL